MATEQINDREQRVADTVQEMGRTARQMVEAALAFDKALARSDQADLLDAAERLAALGTGFSGLYRRLLVTWIRQTRSSAVGHEMSST